MLNKKNVKYIESIASVVLNILISSLKFWVGSLVNSIALISDGWHTLSDSFSSLIVLATAKISDKPSDDNHPYGHGRIEHIGSLIVSFLLVIIALSFMKKSYFAFKNPVKPEYGMFSIIVVLISAVVKLILGKFSIWAGKKFKTNILIADGWHHLTDTLTDMLILTGILLRNYFIWIDALLALIISLLIFKIGIQIAINSIDTLLGNAPSSQIIKDIKKIGNKLTDFEINMHHFHLHTYGDHKEITFHIELPSNLTILKAHDLADRIEKQIKTELNLSATIHIEPKINKK